MPIDADGTGGYQMAPSKNGTASGSRRPAVAESNHIAWAPRRRNWGEIDARGGGEGDAPSGDTDLRIF